MAKQPVWDEMPDRDPLELDLLEIAEQPSPEEGALHIVGAESYDGRDNDEVMIELAIDDGPVEL